LDSYLKKHFDGDELYKLVSKRKKVPDTRLDLWKYKTMCQKDSMFSQPLVHGKLVCLIDLLFFVFSKETMSCPHSRSFTGMCSDLQNIYKAEFPPTNDSDVVQPNHHRAKHEQHWDLSLSLYAPCQTRTALGK